MNGTDAPPAETETPPAEPPADEPAIGDSLEALIKKLFFVADGAGEAKLAKGEFNTLILSWPDDSMARVALEVRPGKDLAVGAKALNDEEAKARNEKSAELKKVREAAVQPQSQPA
jgi:hypothetical protein